MLPSHWSSRSRTLGANFARRRPSLGSTRRGVEHAVRHKKNVAKDLKKVVSKNAHTHDSTKQDSIGDSGGAMMQLGDATASDNPLSYRSLSFPRPYVSPIASPASDRASAS